MKKWCVGVAVIVLLGGCKSKTGANGDATAEDGDGEVVRNPGKREKDGEEQGESVPGQKREHDHRLNDEDDDSPRPLREVVPAVALLPPQRAGVEPASGAGRVGH